jgi:hypothetical protein
MRLTVFAALLVTGLPAFVNAQTQTYNYSRNAGFTKPELLEVVKTYRLPTWGYSVLRLDGMVMNTTTLDKYDGNWQNQQRYQRATGNSSFNPYFSFYRESEPFIARFSSDVAHAGSFAGEKAVFSRALRSPSDLLLQSRLSHNTSLRVQYYPGEANRFFVDVEAELVQQREVSYQSDYYPSQRIRRFSFAQDGFASVSGGFGRIRNVTPTIRAVRFYERAQARSLNFPADVSVLQRTAQQIATLSRYQTVFDRTGKYFWADFAAAIPEMGQPSMFDFLYLTEVLSENTGMRFEGSEVRAGLFRTSELERSKYGTSNLDRNEIHYTGLQSSAEWYKNLSLKSQVHVFAGAGMSTIQRPEMENRFSYRRNVTLGVDALYTITDRVLVESGIAASVLEDSEKPFRGIYNAAFDGTGYIRSSWFVEDYLSASMQYQVNYLTSNTTFNVNRTEFLRRTGFFSASIRYYFIRGAQ